MNTAWAAVLLATTVALVGCGGAPFSVLSDPSDSGVDALEAASTSVDAPSAPRESGVPLSCTYPPGLFALGSPGSNYAPTALDTSTGTLWLQTSVAASDASQAALLCKHYGDPVASWHPPTLAELQTILLVGCPTPFASPFASFPASSIYLTSDPTVCVDPASGNAVDCMQATASACVAN